QGSASGYARCPPEGNHRCMRLVAFALVALSIAALGARPALAQSPVSGDDKPHLLSCGVKDTAHLGPNGNLVPDPPLPPGGRALGRVTSFVIDLQTAVVRLPGLADIAWIPAKGGPDSPELILTPTAGLESATTISIHVHRPSDNDIRFVFFETDRIMTGTCT